jgi:pheromone shutdown protein TraB
MITLVGVGHVFQLRSSVQAVIGRVRPDLVCVELDKMRYDALVTHEHGRGPSVVYTMLSSFQERLAESYGSSVGDEMLAAVEAAKEVGANVALIDMEAPAVFRRVWSELTLKERVWLFMSALGGIFITKGRVEKELERFTEQQDVYMDELGRRFPTLKRILIDERDTHMAGQLRALQAVHPNIVVVLGDGHIPGISKLLQGFGLEHEVLRLSELRSGDFLKRWQDNRLRPEGALPPGASVSFSFHVDEAPPPPGA